MTLRHILTLAILCVALLAGTGCNGVGSGNGEDNDPRPTQTAQELVRQGLSKRIAITSLEATALMKITDIPSDFGLRINTVITARSPNKLRIVADKAAGKIKIFDVVLVRSDIAFHIPRKRRLYQGKVKELKKVGISFRPDHILRELLQPQTGLLLKTFEHDSHDRSTATLAEVSSAGHTKTKITIVRKTGQISQVVQLGKDGKEVFVKEYRNYRKIKRQHGKMKPVKGPLAVKQAWFPGVIHLKWPQDKRSVKITFRTIKVNTPVDDDAFELAVSERTRTLPISKIKLEGDEKEKSEKKK